MFKTRLVEFDGSDAAHRAFKAVIGLAREHNVRLYLARIHLTGKPAKAVSRTADLVLLGAKEKALKTSVER